MKHNISVLIFGALACHAADNLTLNAKPGLWETTTTTERSGVPPIPADALAKMPPDQRARIEAQFKSMSAPTTETKQSCITAEDAVKGFGFDKADASCKRTVLSSTGTKLEMKWECGGTNANTGTVKIETADSSHVTANIDITMGANGRVMNMKVKATSKWLANSCGDVKPNSAK